MRKEKSKGDLRRNVKSLLALQPRKWYAGSLFATKAEEKEQKTARKDW